MNPFFAYKPEKTDEIIGQDKAIQLLESFFNTFKKGKGLFLYGPTGTGKTSAIHAYAKEHNWDILELNASDTRNQKELAEFLSKATGQHSLFGTKKIILLDEVDGLSGTKDRGATTAIVDAIKKSPFPIILTGEFVFDKKFSNIKKICTLVPFEKLSVDAIKRNLEKTLAREQVTIPIQDIQSIARNAAGDMRGALNDLFTFVIVASKTNESNDIRKQTEEISQALIRVFKSTDPEVVLGAYDNVSEDLDKIFLWIEQNIPVEYKKTKDLQNAYTVLALADTFFGRIRRWQYYRFYVYCYLLLSVGIALSKDEKYTGIPQYKQPLRLLTYWQANITYAKRKSIVEKLAEKTKQSTKSCLQGTFHELLPVLQTNVQLQQELELTDDEISWLQKQS